MNLTLTVTCIIQRLWAILVNTLMGHISSETTFNGLHFLSQTLFCAAEVDRRCKKILKIHAMRWFEVIEFEMAYATSYWRLVTSPYGTVSELRRDLRKNLHGDHG